MDSSNDREFWSLYKRGERLEPLRFSNGKTQEDVVKEIVELIKKGEKIIFLHGMCGTGKSAVALNLARVLGRTAIVVPVKNLQRQYEEDYTKEMYVLKKDGKLRISMITGRDNHDSVFKQGISCADPFLPDTIQIVEKNAQLLREYYEKNPLIRHKDIADVTKLRRISIAPANPYWSPIIPADYNAPLTDAEAKSYIGSRGREFIFYHRKKGCGYYDQYDGYINADVIIFNSAKYKIEVALDRKPETEIDIIDECDEFLDSFSNQTELNLTRLGSALRNVSLEDRDSNQTLEKIKELIKAEEKRAEAVGVNEEQIFQLKDTLIGRILSLFLKHPEIEFEIMMDDLNYANKAIEAAKDFISFFNETFLSYRKYEEHLYANLVSVNLSRRLNEILNKNKVFVFMSGTLHSDSVLQNIFGIKSYKIVEAETMHQGEIDIVRTGSEFDCSFRNFESGNVKREDYLEAFRDSVKKAEKPVLVHVNAFEDLPSLNEIGQFELNGLMPREELIEMQSRDKIGGMVRAFKRKEIRELYSTKCSRGVDFPGDVCKSMIFTKYPNPNVQGTFWKILHRVYPTYYWDFYKDKARREFLQRVYRALRSKNDHVYVLSPDSRVLDAVRGLQLSKAVFR